MAKLSRGGSSEPIESETRETDFFRGLLDSALEHPASATAAVAFIVICALLGVFFRLQSARHEQEVAAEYARALDIDDVTERAEALGVVGGKDSELQAEIVYMQGEAAYSAGDYDVAETAFALLQSGKIKDLASTYTPIAVEGLGYIAEEKGDYEKALVWYDEILKKWPGSFVGKRQHNNIARCNEKTGDWKEAVASYREETSSFPGSFEAIRAQNALNRLERLYPHLFSEGPLPEEPAVTDELESVVEVVVPAKEPSADPARTDSEVEQPAVDSEASEITPDG